VLELTGTRADPNTRLESMPFMFSVISWPLWLGDLSPSMSILDWCWYWDWDWALGSGVSVTVTVGVTRWELRVLGFGAFGVLGAAAATGAEGEATAAG